MCSEEGFWWQIYQAWVCDQHFKTANCIDLMRRIVIATHCIILAADSKKGERTEQSTVYNVLKGTFWTSLKPFCCSNCALCTKAPHTCNDSLCFYCNLISDSFQHAKIVTILAVQLCYVWHAINTSVSRVCLGASFFSFCYFFCAPLPFDDFGWWVTKSLSLLVGLIWKLILCYCWQNCCYKDVSVSCSCLHI